MKKNLLYALAFSSIFSLAFFSCGDEDDEPNDSNNSNNSTEQTSSDCDKCKITGFSTSNPMSSGVINEDAATIVCGVASGTDLSSVHPNITIPEGASVSPKTGVNQDFSNNKNVTYTVTYGECTRTYTVKFEEKGSANSSSETTTCDCDDSKYGIKQAVILYVDHADNDKVMHYIFDEYGQKEHIYSLCDRCKVGYEGVIIDRKAQTETIYSHSFDGENDCVFGTETVNLPYGKELYFNRSSQIKNLLAMASLTGAKAISGIVA